MSEYPQKRSEAQQGTSHDAAGGSDDSDLGRPQDARVRVHYRTFEEARATKKKYSDGFIDSILSEHSGGMLTFTVGSESVGLKGYLDKVEATDSDREIIDDPQQIAAIYLKTTEMVARNLKIKVANGASPERIHEVATAKQDYLAGLKDEAIETADKIIDWVEDDDFQKSPCPAGAYGYYGFEVGEGNDTADILEWGTRKAPDVHSNIKIQRQGAGNFIFGYSDSRIGQRMEGKRETLNQRIYLNPDVLDTPEIFEKILNAANEAGIALEMKMLQRSEELGAAHILKGRDAEKGDALRGDGILVYASSESVDDVLSLALAVAEDSPDAFIGRKTSGIAQIAASGIAIGSEPIQTTGQDAESLTEHRSRVLSIVAGKVARSGKSGQEARESFRRGMAHYSGREGIDPSNIAFNLAA
jgi:hypothetical protein